MNLRPQHQQQLALLARSIPALASCRDPEALSEATVRHWYLRVETSMFPELLWEHSFTNVKMSLSSQRTEDYDIEACNNVHSYKRVK
jgi:hypothetical protein